MSSQKEIDDLRTRLEAVESKARSLEGWVAVLVLGLLFALFGDIGWRIWQIDAACDEIIKQHPELEYSECFDRVQEAWANNETTIRVN